ncbi:PTS mannitol transporter subunit IICB [Salinibacterium sp. dk2585]|uniref:PTS mannitol transporter subunit IICB n=1 Tax=unclassified Salinibacterium TaxID=2632331 RepID=UPI0011C256CC|nr:MULTISPECIES: PTS mannitol transporter subunit IICB [unclassified Salinibacterium]QEE60790.1 PTS mannitol transporter subunit IICB [Salinibacterium sp. dk2585]TXK55862.1 PTS mannitol transporter subunit IICB [Salinibacterium sp. dk5596]
MTTESATAPAAAKRGGARVGVQRFGTFLSGMIMPNIGAFIAWGLITAMFIPDGWFGENSPVAAWRWDYAPMFGGGETPDGSVWTGLVSPMITYLLPILIGYTGGRLVYDTRGGVVGAIATVGVIAGTDIPMFLGAMIMGPLTAWLMKQVDKLWAGKIKPGFEMLVDNFSAGILAAILAVAGLVGFAPVVTALSNALEAAVDWLVNLGLLPLLSIFVEPGKILFLNNAINHGVFTPIGTQQAIDTGKSVLFLVEANPGPGLGLLLAFAFFGVGVAKASAPGAIIIQFFGGIHEIYFPYVLMKPILVLAVIAGGMTGVATNVLFNSGLRAPASPGSIFAVLLQTANDSFLGVILSVVFSAAVSFLVAALILRASRKKDLEAGGGDLGAAVAQTEANKGKSSSVLGGLSGAETAEARTEAAGAAAAGGATTTTATRPIQNVVFACDAGMGSSAMGASVLRNKVKKAGIEGVTVVNKSIANLDGTEDLVITHQDLTDRASQKTPNAQHVSVDNFMNSPKYDEVVDLLKRQSGS